MFRSPARVLAALLPEGLPLPVLRGPARGRLWLVGAAPGPSRGLSILWNRSEPQQLCEAERLAQDKTLCFDIGAHAGLYSLIFARHARRVCAFEPCPGNIAWLARTLARNHVANVEVIPWAMSGESGPQTFRQGEHSSLGRLDPGGEMPVYAVSLRDFLARFPAQPEVLKIDVEGAETEVLRGGLEFLRERKPALLLSVHGPDRRRECLSLIRDLGYARLKPLGDRDMDEADEFCLEA